MERHGRRRVVLGMGLASVVGSARAAAPAARRHALLIGVGSVAALVPELWLEGPAHDVLLLQRSLLGAGWPADAIQVLSTAPGHAAPTYAAVRQAMARMLATAQPGDQVLLHFSGHGAQVPAPAHRRQTEVDGLDEVMLLADVQRWQGNAAQGHLPNALHDEALSAWLGQLSAKGVGCWAFLDCCHAAGLMRDSAAPPSGDTLRAVTPADLGVPLPTWQEVQRGAALPGGASSGSDAGGRGSHTLPPPLPLRGRVFACAAGAQAGAVECQLPDPLDGRARRFGLFTHTLAALIRAQAFDSSATLATALRQHARLVQRQGPWPVVVGDSQLRWRTVVQGGDHG